MSGDCEGLFAEVVLLTVVIALVSFHVGSLSMAGWKLVRALMVGIGWGGAVAVSWYGGWRKDQVEVFLYHRCCWRLIGVY